MPTSSIFTNIVINDPEKVEKFIDILLTENISALVGKHPILKALKFLM